jgi:hypothetical protein
MKIFVNRDQKKFVKARVEFDEGISDWSILSSALRVAIKEKEATIAEVIALPFDGKTEEKTKVLTDLREQLSKYKKADEQLDHKNEIPWNGK